MRKFLTLMEFSETDLESVPEIPEVKTPILTTITKKIDNIIFKLRSYSDDTGGEYSEGFENGLEMAASMLSNLLDQLKETE